MNNETAIQRRIMLELSKNGSLVFRNEVGNFWAGQVIHRHKDQVTLKNASMVKCGLCKGSSDLIGVTRVTITPDMVGKTVGLFTAHEVKTSKGRASREQLAFIDAINKAGGIAGIARSPADALDLLPKNDTDNIEEDNQ